MAYVIANFGLESDMTKKKIENLVDRTEKNESKENVFKSVLAGFLANLDFEEVK